MLEDDSDDIRHYALVNLDKVVDEFWFQISANIASVEALYEDDEFKHRELAALIASKVIRPRTSTLGCHLCCDGWGPNRHLCSFCRCSTTWGSSIWPSHMRWGRAACLM